MTVLYIDSEEKVDPWWEPLSCYCVILSHWCEPYLHSYQDSLYHSSILLPSLFFNFSHQWKESRLFGSSQLIPKGRDDLMLNTKLKSDYLLQRFQTFLQTFIIPVVTKNAKITHQCSDNILETVSVFSGLGIDCLWQQESVTFSPPIPPLMPE